MLTWLRDVWFEAQDAAVAAVLDDLKWGERILAGEAYFLAREDDEYGPRRHPHERALWKQWVRANDRL